MDALLEHIEVNPKKTPSASVIWLHGLGASGHDFANIVPSLQLPDTLPVRFLFPHAPKQPITINNGYVMPAWYDVESLDLQQKEDATGIYRSEHTLCNLIEHEKQRGIPAGRIVLAGFSQGGALSLHTGLRYPEPLAGILALSAYLPLANTVGKEASQSSLSTPIMIAHGTMDPLIPLIAGEVSKQQLEQAGYQTKWHTYPMEHTVCLEEIEDISKWLQIVFNDVPHNANRSH